VQAVLPQAGGLLRSCDLGEQVLRVAGVRGRGEPGAGRAGCWEDSRRAPCGARGLKHPPVRVRVAQGLVAPRAGRVD